MKKPEFISKYEHRLTLKNYRENTLHAYLNGLNIFLNSFYNLKHNKNPCLKRGTKQKA